MSFKPSEMPVRSARSQILYLLEEDFKSLNKLDADELSAGRRFLSNLLK